MNWDSIVSWITQTGIKIVIALVILYVAFRLINSFARKIEKKNESGKLDKTLVKTLTYIGKIAAKILVVIALIGYLGIDTSGLTALIASFGVCIGLAVNGAVGNMASGILILVSRPFKVDDFVEVAGYTGTIEDIRLSATKLATLDNRTVYIPNSTVIGGSIVNYSEKDLRRVDLEFSLDYGCDFKKAEEVLQSVLNDDAKVLSDPASTIRVVEQGANGFKICCRAWCKNADYWDVYFNVLENAKVKFDQNGLVIPFQQLDVHVKQ